jgi:hypothetical protein
MYCLFISKFVGTKNYCNCNKNRNQGRKKLLDERVTDLIWTVKKNRRQTSNEISIDYNNHAPQNVSTRTIQR